MDMRDIFRSFLGFEGRHRRNNGFPGSDGQENFEEEEEDCECNNRQESEFPFFFGGGSSGSGLDDMFRHFHGDMHRQMETLVQQMEDVVKGFGNIASDHVPRFDQPRISDKPIGPNPNHDNEIWFFGTPTEKDGGDKNLRDSMLKDDEKSPQSSIGERRYDKYSNFSFKNPFKLRPKNPSIIDGREDSDLDGKVSQAALLDLIKKQEEGDRQPVMKKPPKKSFFSGSSVSMTTVRGPNGKVEQKKVVRDSEGREENTVSRSLNGQTHTVTTITGPEGVEERREDFNNMDTDDLTRFEEKWSTLPTSKKPNQPSILGPGPSNHPLVDPRDMDIFSRFFR